MRTSIFLENLNQPAQFRHPMRIVALWEFGLDARIRFACSIPTFTLVPEVGIQGKVAPYENVNIA
jgi:hypothetical protein